MIWQGLAKEACTSANHPPPFCKRCWGSYSDDQWNDHTEMRQKTYPWDDIRKISVIWSVLNHLWCHALSLQCTNRTLIQSQAIISLL
jgi:hypothetical protein